MKAKLTFGQVIIITIMLQYGVVAFRYARLLAEHLGTNGWLAALGFGACAAVNIGLIHVVFKYGNGAPIYSIASRALPKFIVNPLFLLLAAQWIVLGTLVGKEYLLVLRSISFPTLNPLYMYMLFGSLVLLLLAKGISGIANAASIFFVCLLWIFALVPENVLKHSSLSNLTPFLFEEAQLTWQGLLDVYTAFIGYEMCMLLFPFVDRNTRLIKAVQFGNLFTTLMYLFLGFLSFSFFSLDQLKDLSYPSLNMLSNIRLPFAQRMDDLIFNLIMLRAIFINCLYAWAGFDTLKRMFPASRKPFKNIPIALLLTIMGVTLFFRADNLHATEFSLQALGKAEIVVSFALPVLLLLFILVYKGRQHDA